MKLILREDIHNLGKSGELVTVKDGYGRNYLLPQAFAIRWSKGAEKQITLIKRARSAREIRDLGHANEVRARLEGLKVSLTARAGTGGRLFGSVTPSEVQEAVKAAGGPELDRRRIELPGHIKSLGQYQVSVRLHPEVTAKFALNVEASK